MFGRHGGQYDPITFWVIVSKVSQLFLNVSNIYSLH